MANLVLNGSSGIVQPGGQVSNGIILLASGSIGAVASLDVTGIPSTARRVIVALNGISNVTGSTVPCLQGGTASGGIETAGYTSAGGGVFPGSACGAAPITNGFALGTGPANTVLANHLATLLYMGSNTWAMSSTGAFTNGTGGAYTGCGMKTFSSVLDRIRMTWATADTYDAGTYAVWYE